MIPEYIPISSEELFSLAMRHSSVAESPQENYERLEFYGDAVLDFVITNYLFKRHPEWNQGLLTKARSSIVQEASLVEASKNLKLDQYLSISDAEEKMGARTRPSILSDIFESVVGAIYTEKGLDEVKKFILSALSEIITKVENGDISPHDYKSKLQEHFQSSKKVIPRYQIIHEEGTIHQKKFIVEISLSGKKIATGEGRSKRDAEHHAAKNALKDLGLHS